MQLSVPTILLATFLVAMVPAADSTVEVSPGVWTGVERVVAIGDLHGSYEKLVHLLEGARLLDREGRWSGGATHLVVLGDFLDRGTEERSLMDLLRRLEAESAAAGGRVHVLLGNHEAMNLFRETRYVAAASYGAFAKEEKEAERVAALRSYRPDGIDSRRAGELTEFNRRYPKGYFARQRAFDAEGEYGSWLLGLPTTVKIDGVVYVHGGMTPRFAALGVAGINERTSAELTRHLAARETLEQLDVVTPTMTLAGILAAAEKVLERTHGKHLAEMKLAARQLLASNEAGVLGSLGPLWYRGNSMEDERIEGAAIEQSLRSLDARALVIAHSPTRGRITSRFQGRVFRVDHGIRRSSEPLALIAQGGEMLVLDPSTGTTTTPVRELPNGTRSVPVVELGDGELQDFLSTARVVETRELGSGTTRPQVVVMEKRGQRRRGVFKTVEVAPAGEDPDRYQHEVAAYRLDRQLGLGLVPVTVLRRLEGREGSLQSFVENAVDFETASAYGLEMAQTEDAGRDLQAGLLFDALIGNAHRRPSDLVFRLDGSNRLYLIDHSRAFSLSWDLEWTDRTPVPASFAAALERLDAGFLARELADLLSAAQIHALLERRDRLLEQIVVGASAPGAGASGQSETERSLTAVP